MEQLSQDRRGLFDGLRVPLDLNMLILALVCVVGFWGLIWLTEQATGDTDILMRVVAAIGGGPAGLKPITWIITVGLFLAFWAFFGTAINRIAAMNIAREETVDLKQAAKFAAKKFLPVLWSVVLVAAIFAGFYVVLNATIFGWIGRIPYIGELVVAFLFFLPLLFAFFFTFALVLGIFGLNLASSAIATESSDTWDGISRAFNYILVRPWHVILIYALTAAYLLIFFFFAFKFVDWSVESLGIGWWGMGDRGRIVEVKGEDLSGEARLAAIGREPTPEQIRAMTREDQELWEKKRKELNERKYAFAIPGKVEYILGYATGRYGWSKVPYEPSRADRNRWREDKVELTELENVADLIPGTLKLSAVVIWIWLWLVKFAIIAYALQYFFGANTALYFLLRKEVEGEDYAEIVVEEEELEREAAWEAQSPAAGAPAQPAAAAPAPARAPVPAAPPAAEGAPKPLPVVQPAEPAPAATALQSNPEGEKK